MFALVQNCTQSSSEVLMCGNSTTPACTRNLPLLVCSCMGVHVMFLCSAGGHRECGSFVRGARSAVVGVSWPNRPQQYRAVSVPTKPTARLQSASHTQMHTHTRIHTHTHTLTNAGSPIRNWISASTGLDSIAIIQVCTNSHKHNSIHTPTMHTHTHTRTQVDDPLTQPAQSGKFPDSTTQSNRWLLSTALPYLQLQPCSFAAVLGFFLFACSFVVPCCSCVVCTHPFYYGDCSLAGDVLCGLDFTACGHLPVRSILSFFCWFPLSHCLIPVSCILVEQHACDHGQLFAARHIGLHGCNSRRHKSYAHTQFRMTCLLIVDG